MQHKEMHIVVPAWTGLDSADTPASSYPNFWSLGQITATTHWSAQSQQTRRGGTSADLPKAFLPACLLYTSTSGCFPQPAGMHCFSSAAADKSSRSQLEHLILKARDMQPMQQCDGHNKCPAASQAAVSHTALTLAQQASPADQPEMPEAPPARLVACYSIRPLQRWCLS